MRFRPGIGGPDHKDIAAAQLGRSQVLTRVKLQECDKLRGEIVHSGRLTTTGIRATLLAPIGGSPALTVKRPPFLVSEYACTPSYRKIKIGPRMPQIVGHLVLGRATVNGPGKSRPGKSLRYAGVNSCRESQRFRQESPVPLFASKITIGSASLGKVIADGQVVSRRR